MIVQTAEETGAIALRRPVSVTSASLDPAATGYGMKPTGESLDAVSRQPVLPRRDSKKHAAEAAHAPENRAATRGAWQQARLAATALVAAIEADDPRARFIAVDDLERALGKLWDLRAGRDDFWKMVLNHAQGMLRQLFKEKLVEMLTPVQGTAIRDIVEQHLGPATKTAEDLTEVVRLIADVAGDPYYAISGDPEEE
jgi:hypothetical protein